MSNILQFTYEEIESFKKKTAKDKTIIDWLKANNKEVFSNPIRIQESGLATWALYYYCPKHSTRLKFDITKEKEHRCPFDGEVLTGQPYDGAWWRIVNEKNAIACHHAALIWMLNEDSYYLMFAKNILIEYAKRYESYEEHGEIPHNGPGKANCQTLNEASWILELSYGYDIIKSALTEEQREMIEQRLLLPCAKFMTNHRTNQLHNHEIYINSAIAVIGLLLDNKELLDFSLYNKYGQIYQLENGVLDDSLWFEGSTHYHLFGLVGFFNYEIFARHSKHSNLKHPNYKSMLMMPLKIIEPDNRITLLNDMFYNHGDFSNASLYEFAYNYYNDKEFCNALNTIYKNAERNNIHSFLYGKNNLEHSDCLVPKDYHNATGSGITIFNGDNNRFLLVKHGPFGGEHDHYDRLGISLMGYSDRIAPDLGTTGYGAVLHYDFYKNTGTHNTVVINEGNQPPANGQVLKYEVTSDYKLLDIFVDFDKNKAELDSHTRIEWDEQSYKGAKLRRVILWLNNCFVEIFKVELIQTSKIDWCFHVCADVLEEDNMENLGYDFSKNKPYKYFKNTKLVKDDCFTNSWKLDNCIFKLHSKVEKETSTFFSQGPDNPSVKDITYMVHRKNDKKAIFAHVMEMQEKQANLLQDVKISTDSDEVNVQITVNNVSNSYNISLHNDGCVIK